MPETIPRNPTVQERERWITVALSSLAVTTWDCLRLIDLSLFSLTTNAVA
jgi:hypothetical protein